MKYLSPLFIALGMAFSLSFCAGPLYAGHAPAFRSIPDTLARATLSFAEPSTIVPEGSGRLDIGVVIEAGGNLSGHATVKAAKVSTAVEGVDYNIANPSLSFSAGQPKVHNISLEILNNGHVGGRFLILEIELPDGSLLALGKRPRHIVLIQDVDAAPPAALPSSRVQLSHISSYAFGEGASAEILAYDGSTSRLFVTNFSENKLMILDFSNPSRIEEIRSVHLDVFGGRINSVAAHNGIIAVAIQGISSTGPGQVAFLDTNGVFISAATVGAMPDMLLFSPDGSKVLAANEGEPSDDYRIDPEGSVSIIDISKGVANPESTTLDFTAFNDRRDELVAQGVRIYGPGATVAQDLEPEYIAISDDGATAYVTCQENNALAVVDLRVPEITAVLPFGYKDWAAEGFTLDVSNASGGVFFANWPIKGMYQPDAIDYFTVGGKGYLITANEGDARDYEGFTEEFRVKDEEIVLDERAFPGAEYLRDDALLGRLRVSSASGDSDGDGRYEELYTFGGRSFAIWDAATGALVYDSGNALEMITAADPTFGPLFNTQNKSNDFKSRSDDKGPEPASVKVAELNGTPFAFIALERIGGVVAYRLARPEAPEFVQYINTRAVDSLGGDLSPEGLIYIAPEDSPTGYAYVLAAHEISSSVAAFELATAPAVSFAEANSITEKGAGKLQLELAVEKPGKLSGKASVRVIAPSSAVEGEDYLLSATSVSFEKEEKGAKVIEVDILDSDIQGARYLILELDPESSTVNIGETSRHILLIQDKQEEKRR
ncbi:MAG: choice-of-anchor I family protein [Lewinellaceae bacterium]|nr:choice-of-anchor I family protein [Phaeodactylibacter sp.]MCB9038270.1 choice-of-anchor I family protein [Lewinellaceae bacterium]